ncbi:EF-hand domain-containing protein 1, partial [Trichonephila clavata]
VLRFSGFIREDVHDYSREEYRIRPVKVLYYLQDDTMEVIEPKIPNSGLVQGTLFKRHAFPHPRGKGRTYLWKDLNLRMDVLVLQHNYPHHGLRSMDKGVPHRCRNRTERTRAHSTGSSPTGKAEHKVLQRNKTS